jgi:hypothetical protein
VVTEKPVDTKSKRHWTARRVVLSGMGALIGLALLACVAAVAISTVSSVPVTFVNDTRAAIILPDCGPDLESLPAGATASILVYSPTCYCSIDGFGKHNQVDLVGCLTMPTPLKAHDKVRVSDAKSDTRPCR